MQQCNIYLYSKKKERQQNYSFQLIIAGLKMHFKKMKNKFFQKLWKYISKIPPTFVFTYLCRTYFPLECIWRGIVYSVIKVATNRTCTNFCVLSVSESTYLRTWNQHFISMWPLNIQLEEKKEFWIIQLRNPQLNRIQKSNAFFSSLCEKKFAINNKKI